MAKSTPPQNPIGRNLARLRSQKNWSQEHLATLLQCEGVDVSRDTLARTELGINHVKIGLLLGLQQVFCLPIIRFFPKHIQDLDALFAQKPGVPLPDPDPPKQNKRRCKCPKLTKRRKKV